LNIADLRREYHLASLNETDVDPDPLRHFGQWLEEAIRAELPEPTAMTLATVGDDGRPAARIVLLKGVDHGLLFYTNYESRKGRELEQHPDAALLFHWIELERQVRIEGSVQRLTPHESDAYYVTRPRASRIGAWASPQSKVIESRAWLEQAVSEQTARLGAAESIPRPPFWGGYRVVPTTIEFWQGRSSRLHDRLRYTRSDKFWRIERLAP
jgi:pyridoxamine 5'-phosphate oxidase